MSRARSLGMFVLLPLLECFNWSVKVFWDRLVMPKFNGHFGRVWSSKTQKRDGGSAIKSTHCTYKDTPTPAAVSFSTHAGQLAAAGTTCTSSFRESHITFRLLGHRIHMEHIYTVVFLHKNKKKDLCRQQCCFEARMPTKPLTAHLQLTVSLKLIVSWELTRIVFFLLTFMHLSRPPLFCFSLIWIDLIQG